MSNKEILVEAVGPEMTERLLDTDGRDPLRIVDPYQKTQALVGMSEARIGRRTGEMTPGLWRIRKALWHRVEPLVILDDGFGDNPDIHQVAA